MCRRGILSLGITVVLGLILVTKGACAFISSCHTSQRTSVKSSSSSLHAVNGRGRNGRGAQQQPSNGSSFLLNDFKTASGELINPYRVLKVPRAAELAEIKQSYRNLSRRYHPDGVRHRDILPGSCNNLEDVREEWERIKLSYEILSNKKMRKKYDRNSAIADPGAAMGRAALDAVGWGVTGLGKGLFKVGEIAVNQVIMKENVKNNNNGKDVQIVSSGSDVAAVDEVNGSES